MTFWWIVPIVLIILGLWIGSIVGKQQGDYDFVSPLLGLAIFLGCVFGAIMFGIGLLI